MMMAVAGAIESGAPDAGTEFVFLTASAPTSYSKGRLYFTARWDAPTADEPPAAPATEATEAQTTSLPPTPNPS